MIRLRGEGRGGGSHTWSLTGEDPHSVASEDHPVAIHGNADGPAPWGALEPGKFGFVEFFPPVWPKAAVGGTGDRVFRHAKRRGKEPGDKINVRQIGDCGHDDAPCRDGREGVHVGIKVAHVRSGRQLHEQVRTGSARQRRALPPAPGRARGPVLPPPTALQGNQGISIPRPGGRSVSRTVL